MTNMTSSRQRITASSFNSMNYNTQPIATSVPSTTPASNAISTSSNAIDTDHLLNSKFNLPPYLQNTPLNIIEPSSRTFRYLE